MITGSPDLINHQIPRVRTVSLVWAYLMSSQQGGGIGFISEDSFNTTAFKVAYELKGKMSAELDNRSVMVSSIYSMEDLTFFTGRDLKRLQMALYETLKAVFAPLQVLPFDCKRICLETTQFVE